MNPFTIRAVNAIIAFAFQQRDWSLPGTRPWTNVYLDPFGREATKHVRLIRFDGVGNLWPIFQSDFWSTREKWRMKFLTGDDGPEQNNVSDGFSEESPKVYVLEITTSFDCILIIVRGAQKRELWDIAKLLIEMTTTHSLYIEPIHEDWDKGLETMDRMLGITPSAPSPTILDEPRRRQM